VTATAWFHNTMDRLRAMASPTRADLERAAQLYFSRLRHDLDRARDFDPDNLENEIAYQVEESSSRIADIESQLQYNVFDRQIAIAAARLVAIIGADYEGLSEGQRVVAQQLAARAEREKFRLFIHHLLKPAESFDFNDLFDPANVASRPSPQYAPSIPTAHEFGDAPPLKLLVERYLKRKELSGVGPSQLTEIARALKWLCSEVGSEFALSRITKEQLRSFRDGLIRIDSRLQRQEASFRERQTNNPEHQIKSVTAKRYWNSIQAFFAWAVNEGYIELSPAANLQVDSKKSEVPHSPPPFTTDEVRRLFMTPLYAGAKGPKRLSDAGSAIFKQGHWWSGMLSLFTGMRAGELCQLEPVNFSFDAEIPFVSVTTVDAEGKQTKKAKTTSSVRDTPLHPVLIELGLRKFVEHRAKYHPKKRLFFEFRLGSNGRTSEGMSAFWGVYLKKVGLWAPGRSTHVFRHTVADRLRANGATDENIGAILGHSGGTITAGYGGAQPLSRKALTLEKLDYGFDVVAILQDNEKLLKKKSVAASTEVLPDV
jgi:integrase